MVKSPAADGKTGTEAADACFSALLGGLLGLLVQGAQANTGQTDPSSEAASPKPGSTDLSGAGAKSDHGQTLLGMGDSALSSDAEKAGDPLPLQPAKENSDTDKKASAGSEVKDSASKSGTSLTEHKDTETNEGGKNRDHADAKGKFDERLPKGSMENAALQKKDASKSGTNGKTTATTGNEDFSAAMTNDVSAYRELPPRSVDGATLSRPHDSGPVARTPVADPPDLPEGGVPIVKNGARLTVSLEPDGLGKLDINLSLDKGSVNAQIQASDNATKSLIENNVQQLVDALLKEGLSIGGFSVSLKNGGQEYGAQDAPGGHGHGKAEGAPDAARAPDRPAGGLINLFV